MKPKVILDSGAAMTAFFKSLRDDPCIGLDTEFMRVRTYYPQLCLVQVALADGRLACVDPLAVDTAQLGELLAGFDGEVIIHSAGQDLEVLQHALNYLPTSLFDTQFAAALLGFGEQVSYAALGKTLLGGDIAKGETRTDWSRRPLSAAQLDYAFEDVAYLIDIYRTLKEDLRRGDKLQWMRQASEEVLRLQQQPDDEPVVTRFRAGAGVPVARQALLRELVLWRERIARQSNRPREWIVPGAVLVDVARRRPASSNALKHDTDLNPAQIHKYGDDLLAVVADHGEATGEPIWHARSDLSADQRALVKTLQGRVKRFCENASISPAAVVSRADIEAFVLGRPGRLDSGWRRELLADSFSGLV